MHYRIFSILVTAFLLISCLPTAFAQDNQSEKPVVLYGTPKKYEIADIKVEGAENYEDYVIINLSGLSKGQRSPFLAMKSPKPVNAIGVTDFSPMFLSHSTRWKETRHGSPSMW